MASRSVRLSAIILVILVAVGTLLLAACGGGTTTTTTVSKSTASTATGAALTPKYGGTLRIAQSSIGNNIGWPVTLTGGGAVLQYYYETLLRGDEKGNLKPWLAESYKVADDNKSITFTIRKGVKFTDGSDLTADVVKWNLDQYLTSMPQWASVDVVDPSTVRVNFKTWDNTLPSSFGDANLALYMVSKAAYDKNGRDWITTHPVGTGAFTVASYVSNASLKLVKSPSYWAKDDKGNKLPYLDEVDFTFTADALTQQNMAQAGETDQVSPVYPGRQAAGYKKIGWDVIANPDVNEVWVPDSAHSDSPWSNQKVREAAEYAVDRATIAEKFGYGYLQAPTQIPPRSTTAYDRNFALARNYDPAKAKQLLSQAGYPNGFKTTLIVWPGGNKDIALAEQQYLAAVGIQVEVQFADMAKLTTYLGPTGTWHNAILEMACPAQGPTGVGVLTFTESTFGENWQKPAELTQAIGAATSSRTVDVNLIRAATGIMTKDALIIPVYEVGSGMASQPYVIADFGRRGLPVFNSVEKTWLNK